MNRFTIFIFKLLFIWSLAAEGKKAPWRRNIVSGFYPVIPAGGINIPLDQTAGVGAVPGFGISSVNSLYYGTSLPSSTNAPSRKVFISGINLAQPTGLTSGISISPETVLTSGTGTSTTTGINTLPAGYKVSGAANILQKPGQTSTVSAATDRVYSAGTGSESEIAQSSVNNLSSRVSLNGIDTTPTNDVSIAISESSRNKLDSDPDSLTRPYLPSVTTLPYGYKYRSKSMPREGNPITPSNYNRAAISPEINQSSGAGLSTGIYQVIANTGVGVYPLNGQPSGVSISSSAEQESGAGIQNSQASEINHGYRINKAPETSGIGVAQGTKYTGKTISSYGYILSSKAALGSDNSLYSRGEPTTETEQYTTRPAFSYGSSGVDVKTGQTFSSQIDRPISIPNSQNISVTGGMPVSVTYLQQPVNLPVPLQVPVSVGSQASVPVVANVAVPAPLPFPIVKAILVPVGATPIGGPGSVVSTQGSNIALGSILSTKLAALGR